MYVNASANHFPRQAVKSYLEKWGIIYRSVPAGQVAGDLGAPMSSNLALLGFFASFGESPLSHEALRDTIVKVSPDRFRQVNLQVFDAGFASAAP